MNHLTNQQAARLFLSEMPASDRVAIATDLLRQIVNPGMYAELRVHAHEIARHADCLERQLRAAALRDGFCQPETTIASSGHLPRGATVAASRGPFQIIDGGSE